MHGRLGIAVTLAVLLLGGCGDDDSLRFVPPPRPLRVGVAAVRITPCGANPDWDGPITPSGVWGESFTDTNTNGRWDPGEKFVDDPVNSALDDSSAHKYDGIFMAGFGNNRIAMGCHDDLWARALVLAGPTQTVAIVSVDLVGEVLYGSYYGFAKALERVDPALGVDAVVFSSTHAHEGPDALGLWGVTEFTDGKFPRYLRFVDQQVARAINAAAAPAGLTPARVVAARTNPGEAPQLRGLQVRTSCRPPWFFDQELRALQFIGGDGRTVATLINWNTHPESLEDENTLVSSDFVHYIRARVEADLGGTAVYVSGDLGAVEIVGDTCVGGADPHAADGSNEFDRRDAIGFERTRQLGELAGTATVDALRRGEAVAIAEVTAATARYRVSGSNDIFAFANTIGLLDLDPEAYAVAKCPPGTALCVPVEQQLVTLADRAGRPVVQMLTAPGELLPELFYGVEQFRRTDCPAAATGLPYEPPVHPAMTAPYRLLIGLSPDELGYIVPGYDYYAAPSVVEEAVDPCDGQSYDPTNARRTVPPHYHESRSIGADLAAATTCYALRLLGHEATVAGNAACQRVMRAP